ncbi:hypothetical protein D3C80_1670290 [compost metagenome]
MGDHQHTGAVGDQDDRPVDLFQLVLDRPDAGIAIELVGFQWRHTAYLFQPGFKQRLPMFGNVLAQARYDQNGCGGLQFVQFNTYAFSMTRLALWPGAFCRTDIKDRPPLALFIGRQALFI